EAAITLPTKLQWSRRANATETWSRGRDLSEDTWASMEPSRERDGDALRSARGSHRIPASMEPSRERDGDSSSPKPSPAAQGFASMEPSRERDGDSAAKLGPRVSTRLQWSRRANATETDERPAHRGQSDGDASMEPSRERDGDVRLRSRV